MDQKVKIKVLVWKSDGGSHNFIMVFECGVGHQEFVMDAKGNSKSITYHSVRLFCKAWVEYAKICHLVEPGHSQQ